MTLHRRTRRLSALVAVAAFLFAQFAVSVFACPMQGGTPRIEMTANLCQMHETSGDISADTAVPVPPALPAPSVLLVPVAPEPPATTGVVRRLALPAGPPPPLIGTVVLRI